MQRDYLFRRGSIWWLRFVYPPDLHEQYGAERKFSLKTRDLAEARVKAAGHIAEHQRRLLALQNEKEGRFRRVPYIVPPGIQTLADGTRVYADEKVVVRIGIRGDVTEGPNGALMISSHEFDPRTESHTQLLRDEMRVIHHERDGNKRAKWVKKDDDDEVIEAYLTKPWKTRRKPINRRDADDARKVWAQFKALANKPLVKCDREDGRRLMEALEAEGHTTKTIDKKLSYLRAAINRATDEHKHKGVNPFERLYPAGKDGIKRLPLYDADMQIMREVLENRYFGTEEHLLWVMCATTGMRVSECFIEEEFEEDGYRYLITGSKTRSSHRRVPLPQELCNRLQRIDGPVFRNSAHNLGRNLNRIMDRAGITDRRKCVHSLRHRASDRLRAVGCPVDVRWQLLGHEDDTVAEDYGEGHRVATLWSWQSHIGY